MSAPPEANTEYSRGSERIRAAASPRSTPAQSARIGPLGRSRRASSSRSRPGDQLGARGPRNAWAPIPLALLARRSRRRAGAIGRRSPRHDQIAPLGDLPDAHATGLIGSGASQYAEATSNPSAGLYMETLGAVVLLLAGGVGFLLLTSREPAGTGAAAARET